MPKLSLTKWAIIAGSLCAAVVLLPWLARPISKVLRSSNEGATKNSLGQIRDAIFRYNKATGANPSNLTALIQNGKYLESIPLAATPPYHRSSAQVHEGTKSNDAGGWMYNDSNGGVWVNCTHTDTKLQIWDGY
jgi:hypothetical protein